MYIPFDSCLIYIRFYAVYCACMCLKWRWRSCWIVGGVDQFDIWWIILDFGENFYSLCHLAPPLSVIRQYPLLFGGIECTHLINVRISVFDTVRSKSRQLTWKLLANALFVHHYHHLFLYTRTHRASPKCCQPRLLRLPCGFQPSATMSLFGYRRVCSIHLSLRFVVWTFTLSTLVVVCKPSFAIMLG